MKLPYIPALIPLLIAPAMIHAGPDRFATSVESVVRPAPDASELPSKALGGPTGAGDHEGSTDTYTLGQSATDGGASLTLGFDVIITDDPGPDFIVFENGFYAGDEATAIFGELAFVEVSSNGIDFARFPNDSQIPNPLPAFGTFNPSLTTNLAGNRPTFSNVLENPLSPFAFDPATAGGTGFDLSALANHPMVSEGHVFLDNIRFVRLIDIKGDGTYFDTSGDPIYDPTGALTGADIDAVAVIHFRESGNTEWLASGRDGQSSSRQHFPARVTRLLNPEWRTGAQGLILQSRPVEMSHRLYAWGANTGGDNAFVKAFDTLDGSFEWVSPNLPPANAIDFESWSAPTADPATNAIYFATDGMAYRLDAKTGDIEWDEPLDDGGSSEVINSSCTVAGGLVFIATYGGFNPANKRLYALDVTDGSVKWSVQDGGPGSEAPVVVNGRVFTLNANGMSCYNAETGVPVWKSSAPLDGSGAWTTGNNFLGGLAYSDGALFASTYSFGTVSELVAVHANNGALLWSNNTAVNADGLPVVIDNRIYVVGEAGFGGPSFLATHDIETGLELGRVQTSADAGMWNMSAAGTNDGLYFTEGVPGFGFDPMGLHFATIDDGIHFAERGTDAGDAAGSPIVGSDGSVYVLTSDGGLMCFRAPEILTAYAEDADGDSPAGTTNQRTVKVFVQGRDADEVLVHQEGSAGAWQPFISPINYEVSDGDGIKKILVQTRNGSGYSQEVETTIILRTTPPITGWQLLGTP